MTEDYSVQQRPSAIPYAGVGAVVGGVGSALAVSKIGKVKEWTHKTPAYTSFDDLVSDATKGDSFTTKAKDAGIAEEDVKKLTDEVKKAGELYDAKVAEATKVLTEGKPKEVTDDLKKLYSEYLEAFGEHSNAKKVSDAATGDAKTAAEEAVKTAEKKMNNAKDAITEAIKNLKDEAKLVDAKTGEDLTKDITKILGEKSEATKKIVENSSVKDSLAKLTKGAMNWKGWAGIAGATVLCALLGLVFRPKEKDVI